MTKIQSNLNSLVKQIVNRLDCSDSKDNKADGFIKAKEWKQFIQSESFVKGRGNTVSSCITVANAEKSILHYLSQQAKTEQKQIDLAEKWFNKLTEDADRNFEVKSNKKVSQPAAQSQPLKPQNPVKSAEPINFSNVASKVRQNLNINLVHDLEDKNNELSEFFAPDRIINNPEKAKREIANLMRNEVERRRSNDPHLNPAKIDFEYWSEKIYNVAKQNNVQPALLIAIMAQETNGKFDKNIDAAAGRGVMGITTIAVEDFFTEKAYWYPVYKALDEELLNDILYNKHTVKPNLNYPTAKDLRNACAKDEEFGLKVGLLVYEMKYAREVARKIFNISNKDNPSAKQVMTAINFIKAGKINLTSKENQKLMANAARNYNGNKNTYTKGKNKGRAVKDVYQEQVLRSLKNNNYQFSNDYILNRKTT